VDIADLLHPEAIVVPFLAPSLVLDAGSSRTYLEERSRDRIRGVRASSIEDVGDGRFVVTGRVRWSTPGGNGFSDRGASWAVVVRDGLIHRMKGTRNRQQAMRILEQDDWTGSS
jgi:hypothetical protein